MESESIKWYAGIYPYTEIVKTSEQEPYLFALLLNDKLVAIGDDNGRDGGVLEGFDLIFYSWTDLRKNLSIHQKQKQWEKLFDLIKGKKFIGKRELPPQPRQILYRTFCNDEIFVIYENKWKKPKRFSLCNSNDKILAKSYKLSDITERLSNIIGRKITLLQ